MLIHKLRYSNLRREELHRWRSRISGGLVYRPTSVTLSCIHILRASIIVLCLPCTSIT